MLRYCKLANHNNDRECSTTQSGAEAGLAASRGAGAGPQAGRQGGRMGECGRCTGAGWLLTGASVLSQGQGHAVQACGAVQVRWVRCSRAKD